MRHAANPVRVPAFAALLALASAFSMSGAAPARPAGFPPRRVGAVPAPRVAAHRAATSVMSEALPRPSSVGRGAVKRQSASATTLFGTRPATVGGVSAVDFVPPATGWVATSLTRQGNAHVLLWTGNGGSTWWVHGLPKTYRVLAIHSLPSTASQVVEVLAEVSSPTLLAAAAPTVVILSSDSGFKNWQVTYRARGVAALERAAILARVGFDSFGGRAYAFIGDRILATQHLLSYQAPIWRPLTLPQGVQPVSMSFSSASTGLVAGQECASGATGTCRAVLLRTRDGGRQWARVFTAPPWLPAYTDDSAAVDLTTSRDGSFFMESTNGEEYLYRTTDGGTTWARVPTTIHWSREIFGAPTFTTPQVGWLAVENGPSPFPNPLFVTRNGGRTWTAKGVARQWNVTALSLVSPRVGYVGGVDRVNGAGYLFRTTDGGKTWSQVLPSPQPHRRP